MNDIRTTLYDLIGYLFPGAIVTWAIIELINLMGIKISDIIFFQVTGSIQILLLLAVSYALGHLLHAIANVTIDLLPFGSYPPKNYFPKQFNLDFNEVFQAQLADTIKLNFKLDTESDSPSNIAKNSYWLCYTYVTEYKTQSLSETFLSLSGFYRGLSVGGFITALMYFLIGLASCNTLLIWFSIIATLIGFVFLARVARFKRYLTKTVYTDFMSFGNKANE